MQQLILGIGNAIQWVIEPYWIKFISKDYLQIFKKIQVFTSLFTNDANTNNLQKLLSQAV